MQDADRFARVVLATTLVLAAAANALLMAPAVIHRFVFHRRMRLQLVEVSSALAQGGLLLVFCAVVGTCLLALDAILARSMAIGLTAAVAVWFALFWFVLPLILRRGSARPSRPGRS